ncbi:MAG: AMP nucleosidase, partial [Burkholderiaceae bacterium]
MTPWQGHPKTCKESPVSVLFSPEPFPPESFDDAAAALARVKAIYDRSRTHLMEALQGFISGQDPVARVRACYPYVKVRTQSVTRADSRLSFGFVAGPGAYETTLTRPDLFATYLEEQFRLLHEHHGVGIEVGVSRQPMPLHFALAGSDHLEGYLPPERRARLPDWFDLPDLSSMDDGIANGTHESAAGQPDPLALFTAPRIDYSLARLRHYTGTAPEHFQQFVLFTNYQFYIDEFVKLGHELMSQPRAAEGDDYVAFVEPGNLLTRRAGEAPQAGDTDGQPLPRLPQMPAYHLVRPDGLGIT